MSEKFTNITAEEKTTVATPNSQEKLVASIVALERFQIEIRGVSGREAMLELTLNHLKSLLPIRLAGFFFPHKTELRFTLETALDPSDADCLTHLVDRSIESGVFGWALKHTRPAAFKMGDDQGRLILGALRTRQKVLGMFATVIHPASTSGWDANITVLATYLACAADAIFSEQLTAELQEHNRKLDDQVRQRTRQLEAAKDAAEVANRAKDTFLATISHELRTPLNAILGYSQRLRRHPDLKPVQAEQMETIHNSAEHLLSLINDLLDLAKAEASHIELNPSLVDIRRLAAEIASIVQHRVEEKQLAFRCVIDPMAPEFLQVDPKRFKQVLINLLGNAVKFTNQGSVELRIFRSGDMLRFCVADTGCGIDPQLLPQLGRPFHQLGDSAQRAGGSGLGLAISKQLIHAMGGKLMVESEPGKGSQFWFEHKCAPPSGKEPASDTAEPIQVLANKSDPPLNTEHARILRELAAAGDVLELKKQLQSWAATTPNATESKLLEMAKGFRINAIKRYLSR